MNITSLAFNLFLAFSVLILPWMNRKKIRDLTEEVKALRNKLNVPQQAVKKEEVKVAKKTPVLMEKQVEVPSKTEVPKTLKKSLNFEELFGGRLPVWIGGIALILAGVFTVKYSIDIGLLSPIVRIVLALVLGFVLLGIGHWVRLKPTFANGVRISQALSGAAVAILYVSVFAAHSLYGLVSPTVAFIGMAAVTGMGTLLSLKQGRPIAILGLVSGFLTPTMIQAESPSPFILFMYLYLVFSSAWFVISKKEWWELGCSVIFSIQKKHWL